MSIIDIAGVIEAATNNTFIGTLFAGLIIAYSGLWLYRKQKKLDLESSRKDRLQSSALSLLTHINVAVKDYLGQVSIYDGSNAIAKAIFIKMEALSPGFAVSDTMKRFNKYANDINQVFNELSTPLALNEKNEDKVKILAGTIPQLTFLLSATSTLSGLPHSTLKDVARQSKEYSDILRKVLEDITKN